MTALLALANLDERWLVLDTETTGLGPQDVVVEIAAIDARGRIRIETLVQPGRPMTAKAQAVHGLSEADLASAPTWSQVWPGIQQQLRRSPMLAWNAAFDLRLMRQTCDRHDLPFLAPRAICLRAAFQELRPRVRSTLEAACLTLGVGTRPEHRALADARVAREVGWRLIEMARDRFVIED